MAVACGTLHWLNMLTSEKVANHVVGKFSIPHFLESRDIQMHYPLCPNHPTELSRRPTKLAPRQLISHL